MNSIKHFNVIIIGGGPSGMMSAGSIVTKNPEAKVLILEKNKTLGQKLSITGGGRCNITNAIFENRDLLKHFGNSEKFLYSTFDQFSVQNTFDFFEKRGLSLVTESYNRVFPQSQKATDVVEVMKNFITHPNIIIKTNTIVKKINKNKNSIDFIETSKGETYTADSYILATGGLSHSETGSTGDGFRWLEDLGHKIKKPTPTLVPWIVSDSWIHEHSGTAIDNCKITINTDDKKFASFKGRILCTHTGLSGPIIMNHSSKLQDALYGGFVNVYIDLYPDKNHKEIDEMILKIFDQNKNKKIKNVLSEIFGLHNTHLILQKHLPINIDTPVNLISKEYRKSLIQLLKKIPIQVRGLEGYEKSIVADGGISLNEIDTKTMRSKIISNLFITGDLLDVRRPSGGFSLQLCWTTGYVAGINSI